MWEMPILSIVSELMHNLQGDIETYNPKHEYERCVEKTRKILSNGLILSDMGTRRRMSFDHQNMVIRTMKEVYEQGGYTDNDGFHPWTGRFAGTSNVYLCYAIQPCCYWNNEPSDYRIRGMCKRNI